MPETRYLIAGSSHAALEALAAIRMHDAEGAITVVTRDTHLPYSPTVLPYVVSGQSDPARVKLRDEAFFAENKVAFVRGAGVAAVDPAARSVRLADTTVWRYEKLLLATGAVPAVPPIPGLDRVPYHVLRTMDDAVVLNAAIREAQTAVVLGAGLVGMHAAENLARAGAKVTVVERLPQVLPGYFDARAARIIETAFARNGATMRLGRTVTAVAPADGASLVTLDDGERIAAGMILVATGVRPAIDYLAGSGIAVDRGVLVDDAMRTSAEDVWAAGDVAQARDFFGTGGKIGGILPDAVEQGRIAGMSMAGDPAARGWQGGVPLNTYHFFGDHAVSVGLADVPAGDHVTEVDEVYEPATPYFRKIILRDGRLVGISAINAPLDPGIMWQLILRKVDLRPVMADFVRRPLETGRILMSQMWR